MNLIIKGTFFFDLIQIIELLKNSHYVISTQDDFFKILQVWKKFVIVFYFFSIKKSFYRSKPQNYHKINGAKLIKKEIIPFFLQIVFSILFINWFQWILATLKFALRKIKRQNVLSV